MAQKLVITTEHTNALAQGTTRYQPVHDGHGNFNATESFRGSLVRDLGTYDYLTVLITANSLSSTYTVNSRVAAGAGNQTATKASGTGTVQDTTHSDSPTAGQTIGSEHVAAAGTGTASIAHSSMRFAASSNSAMKYGVCNGANYATASSTFYSPLAGQSSGDSGVTAAQYQSKFLVATTLQKAQVTTQANSRTSATSFTTNINGSPGNVTVPIPLSSGAVTVEDTTHSDSIAINDLVEWVIVTGIGVGTLTLGILSVDALYTGAGAMWLAGGDGATGVNQIASAGNNIFLSLQGRCLTAEVTEANVAMQNTIADTPGDSHTFSNMSVYVASVTTGDAVTVTSRKNSGAGNQTITVNAGDTTVYKEDTTHSDVLAQTDTMDMRAASGGSVATRGFFTTYGMLATGPGAAPSTGTITSMLSLMGVG